MTRYTHTPNLILGEWIICLAFSDRDDKLGGSVCMLRALKVPREVKIAKVKQLSMHYCKFQEYTYTRIHILRIILGHTQIHRQLEIFKCYGLSAWLGDSPLW